MISAWTVMPALVAGIHALSLNRLKDVDGRDKKPGYDGGYNDLDPFRINRFGSATNRQMAVACARRSNTGGCRGTRRVGPRARQWAAYRFAKSCRAQR
jgi:hypothetical protein